MQKITPFLWFDGNGEEAINFYTSIFKDSATVSISRYGKGAPMPEGTMITATFRLQGQEFMALNGGPMFQFTPAISLFIKCKDQEEVNYFWDSLLADGGTEERCGWLRDRFGLSWQIIPDRLGELLNDKDGARAQRAMMAMLGMQKIDIAELERAANG
ncbi:VOC family protein [Nemorincola caseinilytica]|uniref:VOC family protein n=1 Tax=Nemorincola caseinilytica TaxID=2054315 RepID=A0ABP8NHY2_9BACT